MKKALLFTNRLLFYMVVLLSSFAAGSSALANGGSFAELTKSYRPADVSEVKDLNVREKVAYGWRGERVNFQIILWADEHPVQVQARPSALKNKAGNEIPSKAVKLDFLKFIAMNTRDAYATNPEHIEMVPDMLNGKGPVSIGLGKVQPLWVGIDIPRDAQTGVYQGAVNVQMDNQSMKFPITINVLPLIVPAPKDWSFKVNYWTHPQACLHYYLGSKFHGQDASRYKPHASVKELLWTDKHLALYRPTLELLRDAGMKSITVNLTKDPWLSAYRMKREQHQTNYPYDELIHWRRKADGSFTFDFTDFEKYVQFCMSLGIDEKIECFSMLPWVQSKFSAVSCFDESVGKERLHYFESWEEYDKVWSAFIKEFVPVLIKNGWFEKTVMGVDERGLGNMHRVEKILEKFKHKGARLRLSAAANKTHSFDDSLDQISMHGGYSRMVNNRWSEEQFAKWAAERRTKGLISTWYTCTGTYPGNFGNSRPAESLFIGWYSARLGADGYLRWAVDSWNDNPTETTDHKVFETGDIFQLYPGDRDAKKPFTRSSVRFELFRQGIVDYEKIRVLRKQFPQTREAIDAMLKEISRPKRPVTYPNQSSVTYDENSADDFSDITNRAQRRLLEITLNALRSPLSPNK